MVELNEIVLGTHNRKKCAELDALLAPSGVRLSTLSDYAAPLLVVEDGDTFGANASKKALEQARHLNRVVLGEDSGLVVDALDGAPGIYSARFAGEGADDESNNQHLLERLAGVPLDKRTAHYVCHMSLADPTGKLLVDCEATCWGRIRTQPAGAHGFGYDPLFEVMEYHKTFGELGPAVKSVISHRAKAMRRFVAELLAGIDQWQGKATCP